ncbi:hypothetical protein [Pendulispora albinea]|uniref:Uncharacterized protein n=1 Tax=Pendulispora albinea TaxID=2741071 RepID=A0ABZ2M353_9BACT
MPNTDSTTHSQMTIVHAASEDLRGSREAFRLLQVWLPNAATKARNIGKLHLAHRLKQLSDDLLHRLVSCKMRDNGRTWDDGFVDIIHRLLVSIKRDVCKEGLDNDEFGVAAWVEIAGMLSRFELIPWTQWLGRRRLRRLLEATDPESVADFRNASQYHAALRKMRRRAPPTMLHSCFDCISNGHPRRNLLKNCYVPHATATPPTTPLHRNETRPDH